MKRGVLAALFFMTLILIANTAYSQGRMRGFQKMEELKKIKLIEILQMDEETSIKFFASRSEHMKRMDELNKSRDKLLDDISELLKSDKDKNNPTLKKLVNEYLQSHEKISKERQSFFKSVREILTTEQMAKFVVFEERFRNEVGELLMKERNKRFRD